MNSKITTKVLATFLAFLLSFTNVAMLGSYANKTYAAETKLEEQSTLVDNAELDFDVYFQENGQNVHNKTVDVEKGENLYLRIKVQNGYLSNGQVIIENANFKVQNLDMPSEMIQNISTDENKVTLNQINRDESVIFEIPIKMNTDSSFDINNISKTAAVTLSGVYMNSKGKEIEVNKTIKVQTTLSGTTQSFLNGEVTKYVTFDVNGNKGVILQTLFTSNLVNNILPVKSTKLEIEIPVINNIKPKVITLSAKSLMATKGEGTKVFTKEDYTYENGKIILNVENNEEIISWKKNASDQIMLTCIYEENAIVDTAKVKFAAKSEITCYAENLMMAKTEVNGELELKEQIGDIVTLENKTDKDTVYNGYMVEKNGKGTSFVNTLSLNIGYNELIDSIAFNDKVSYVDEIGNSYPSNALYKYLKVSKENIVEILGEDGYINVCSKTGEQITTLNKDNTEFKFENGISGITFETSKPINEGVLEIENGREITPLEYSKEQMQMFKSLKVTFNADVKKDSLIIISGSQDKNITLEGAKSQATLNINTSRFSTVVKNEGVELRVTLNTANESTKLYKNPEVTIEFPNYITNVDIENVNLIYEKELKIANAQMYKNGNGNIVVNIKLNGEQTSYNENAVIEGATLVMNADVTVNKLTPTSIKNAILKVKNENGNEEVNVQTGIDFVAPAGIATVNQVTSSSNSNDSAVSISGQMGTLELETGASVKRANVKIIAINNYTYDCDNVVILGRTPSKGNKEITTNKELGSTFSAKMVSEIKSQNGINSDDMKVYYSSNNAANSDLGNTQNGWTTNINEVDNVSSYMIVLDENYKMATGEIMAFDYDIEIPENLTGNEKTYATFGMYYEEADDEQDNVAAALLNRTMSIQSTPIALVSEGKSVENLSVILTSNAESKEVAEKSYIEYTAKITNNGEQTIDGVYLNVHTPENAVYINPETGEAITGKVQIIIGSVKPGVNNAEEVKFTLRMGTYTKPSSGLGGLIIYDENGNIVTEHDEVFDPNLTRDDFDTEEDYQDYLNELEERKNQENENGTSDIKDMNTVSVKISVGVANEEGMIESEALENTLIQGKPAINMSVTTNNQGYIYADDKTEITYVLSLRKENTQSSLTGVKVKLKVPEGMKFIRSSVNYESYENEEIVWGIDTLDTYKYISVTLTANKIPSNSQSFEKDLPITFFATCDQNTETFNSNTINTKSYLYGFTLTQSCNINTETISAGDEVKFTISIKNLSPQDAQITVKDKLPNELQFIEYYYKKNEETIKGTNNTNVILNLTPGEAVEIYVLAKAKLINEKTRNITNVVTLAAGSEEIKANDITLVLKGTGIYEDGDEITKPEEDNSTYTISGTAWLDANGNGKRETNEELLSGINVYLLDSTTKRVVDTTKTNSNGLYIFREIQKGSFVVVFEYDTVKYDLTTYKTEGVDDSINSDAINMELTINGNKKKYAVTNTIVPTKNIHNIDLGLVDNPKFDLELKKGVKLIQVSNNSGTQSYNFNNTDSAQVQIAEKYMKGSVVAITYTISVTNTGVVAGYVNKIVDYKAKDLIFNSALNPEWYEDTDGNLYTTSIAGKEIKPGETLEVSLILTKTMTDDNIGISNNTAEIYEASNDLGLADIDSTPGNRKSSEDDYGLADVFITLKTGGILLYGGIFIFVIAIFAFGAYEINKRILRKI